MKQCCEYLRGLRYKLWKMGIPVNGPCYIQGHNQSISVGKHDQSWLHAEEEVPEHCLPLC